MRHHTARKLLITPSTLGGAGFWCPLRDFAILEEARVARLHLLEEITTNLPQRTQLGLEVNVVLATSLHRLQQVIIVLLILLRHLSTGFTSG
jgi:hypothetical protein